MVILEYVNQHGKVDQKLAEILNRGLIDSIRERHGRLMSENEYDASSVQRAWTLEEDETLIRYILKLKGTKNKHDINWIENILAKEFSECAKALKRSNLSCHDHRMDVIAPALKTHSLGLPLNGDWKLKMMSYIVENKIKHEKEVDSDLLLDKIAPGQTKKSLLHFESNLRRVDGKRNTRSELPFYQIVENKLKEQSQTSPCFNKNHKGEEKRLKRANDIIDIYLKAVEL